MSYSTNRDNINKVILGNSETVGGNGIRGKLFAERLIRFLEEQNAMYKFRVEEILENGLLNM